MQLRRLALIVDPDVGAEPHQLIESLRAGRPEIRRGDDPHPSASLDEGAKLILQWLKACVSNESANQVDLVGAADLLLQHCAESRFACAVHQELARSERDHWVAWQLPLGESHRVADALEEPGRMAYAISRVVRPQGIDRGIHQRRTRLDGGGVVGGAHTPGHPQQVLTEPFDGVAGAQRVGDQLLLIQAGKKRSQLLSDQLVPQARTEWILCHGLPQSDAHRPAQVAVSLGPAARRCRHIHTEKRGILRGSDGAGFLAATWAYPANR